MKVGQRVRLKVDSMSLSRGALGKVIEMGDLAIPFPNILVIWEKIDGKEEQKNESSS